MASYYLSAFADEAGIELDEQIAALQRNRIRYMEIRGLPTGPIDLQSDYTVREVKKKLDANGIGLSAIGSRLGKTPITANFLHSLESLRRLCEICHMMEAKRIRMFSFFMPEGCEDVSVYADEVVDRLNRLCDFAESQGIRLMHENEAAIYGEKTAEVLEIHRRVPRLGGIFDPSNYRRADVDQAETVRQVMPFIHYLHIKDCKNDHTIVPAGHGDALIGDTIEAHDKLWEGESFLTLEPHLFKFQGYSEIDKSELKLLYSFANKTESFDFAVKCLKEVLTERGFTERRDLAWIR